MLHCSTRFSNILLHWPSPEQRSSWDIILYFLLLEHFAVPRSVPCTHNGFDAVLLSWLVLCNLGCFFSVAYRYLLFMIWLDYETLSFLVFYNFSIYDLCSVFWFIWNYFFWCVKGGRFSSSSILLFSETNKPCWKAFLPYWVTLYCYLSK